MAEEYLDFSQALDALEITETELWELIHSGTLKAYRAGGVIKFKKSDIIAYQKSRGTEPTIVVSRKMLDSMEASDDDDEEGIDTEVGLRAAKRPSQDDLATSEVTVKEPAVRRRRSDSEETAPISGRPRRASARAAGAPAPGARSSRISQVLETEKKGNPIMNVVMILAIVVCIYQGLVLYATACNQRVDNNGSAVITKPAFITEGLFQWGEEFGSGNRLSALRDDMKKYEVVFSDPVDTPDTETLKEFEDSKKPPVEEDDEVEEVPEEVDEAPEE